MHTSASRVTVVHLDMLSEEITSGELYYHVETGHGQASIADSKSYSQVRSFLRRDNKEVEDGSIKIRQTRKLLLQSRAAKVQHLDEALMELISNRVEHKMLAAHREMMDLNQKIRLYKQQFDHCALQSVLQYASVLQQEIIEANTLLQQERLMKDSLKDQASLTREFKTYCAHLKLETKGKIELTALSSNSAQFVRCVKAVHDNLNNCFGFGNTAPMLPTPQNVNIINVFKLKNSFLAKAMQVHFVFKSFDNILFDSFWRAEIGIKSSWCKNERLLLLYARREYISIRYSRIGRASISWNK